MPWRTLLLPAFAAGQGQSTCARWAPLLSLAVPCFMPQTCPKGASGCESFERRSKRRSASIPMLALRVLDIAAEINGHAGLIAHGPCIVTGFDGGNITRADLALLSTVRLDA